MKKLQLIGIVLSVMATPLMGQPRPAPVGTTYPTEQTPVHDPVMIQEGNTFYLFCTGFGISVYSSTDMNTWVKNKPVFDKAPQWAVDAVPGYRGHTWAPDISFHHGQYYLYYSVSAFGKNTSCIGVATNKTLDPASPDFAWVDHGKLIQSVPGRDMWNAIDPNLVLDEQQTPWLTFGSFWNGMKQVKLNADLVSVAQPETWFTVAARPRNFSTPDTAGGNAAIEAPFVFKKDGFYYLFVSWDYCCRAEKSNYKIVVGRSQSVNGPFLDKTGKPMWQGGGSILAEGDGQKWFGVGHCAAYTFNNKDWIIYHGYDVADKGRSKLLIKPLQWDVAGWPALTP